ncbi:MAG: fatty acid--CoA ligase [Geobacteraceae bacterium]|nr:fatty acid--CoA ligase [Geobacteraceae bacterium]
MQEHTIPRTPSAYDYPLLIKHLLDSPLVNAPDQEIVYRDLKRHSYREFRQRINRLANALEGLGIKAGDTVAVMDWDSHRYLECYFAVPMMGAVLHTVNIRLSPEQLLYTINHAEDDVILVNADFLPMLEQIRDRIGTVRRFVLLNDRNEPPQTSLEFAAEYEEMLAGSPSQYDFLDFDENSRATTFYTTGTTGSPKGVYFSHRQLVLHSLAGLAALGTPNTQGRFHQEDVYMPITPMFHVHAWGIPYVATAMGLKQVYPGRYTPEVLLGAIRDEKVTFSHCVPTILHMLLSCPDAKEVNLSNWKVIIGGSALPKALCRAAMDRGVDIFTGYGMSETCPILTLAHLEPDMLGWDMDEQVALRCKSGRPVPLVDLRVVDEQMNDVPHDGKATGEVVVRAPWLTQGYFKDPENSERLWQGGYLHTHDVANIDSRGYLKICDRTKDVIKTGGEWLSSLEIEDIVAQHPAVSEVAVIGMQDEKWGERPMALVLLKAGWSGKTTEDAIKSHVREHAERGVISPWAIPDRVLFVAALDKTSVGKIDKKVLREKYRTA